MADWLTHAEMMVVVDPFARFFQVAAASAVADRETTISLFGCRAHTCQEAPLSEPEGGHL